MLYNIQIHRILFPIPNYTPFISPKKLIRNSTLQVMLLWMKSSLILNCQVQNLNTYIDTYIDTVGTFYFAEYDRE